VAPNLGAYNMTKCGDCLYYRNEPKFSFEDQQKNVTKVGSCHRYAAKPQTTMVQAAHDLRVLHQVCIVRWPMALGTDEACGDFKEK